MNTKLKKMMVHKYSRGKITKRIIFTNIDELNIHNIIRSEPGKIEYEAPFLVCGETKPHAFQSSKSESWKTSINLVELLLQRSNLQLIVTIWGNTFL